MFAHWTKVGFQHAKESRAAPWPEFPSGGKEGPVISAAAREVRGPFV